jgi:hypothetical protein
MKQLFFTMLLSLTAVLFSSQIVLSQTSQNDKPDVSYNREGGRQYKFLYDFSPKTKFNFKLTYNTLVTRTFSDKTTKTFERDMVLFFSYWQPSPTKEGFSEISVGLDSIKYNYSDGKKTYSWATVSDNDDIPSNYDFDNVFPLVGRFFDVTLSPYFEMAKIEGKILDEVRSGIEKMGDTTLRKIWRKANADENFFFLIDMNKNVYKSGRFEIDSTWKMKFTIPIEGIRYTCDTAKVKFYSYDGKYYNVKAEMPRMYPNLKDSNTVMGMDRVILPVDSTSFSTGFWDMSISPRGLPNLINGSFTTTTNSSVNEQQFSDIINTTIKYEFLSLLRWKD